MIEYRTAIKGARSHEIYLEYSPPVWHDASLEERFRVAAERVAFLTSALEMAGIGEPMIVVERPIAHTPQDLEQLRTLL